MAHTDAIWHQLKPYVLAFRTHAKLWMIPTLAATFLAVLYALWMPNNWRASQAVLVRNEAIGNENGQGQFGSIDWMKVYQEKILEVARSRKVVEAVLRTVGPPDDYRPEETWPSEDAMEALQASIHLTAPKGAEFGRTEFFHLSITGRSPAIALELCRVLCDELEKNLGAIRDANAASVIAELQRAEAIAREDLDAATESVATLEREVGQDLGELRLLTESGSGDSNLRSSLNEITHEIRQAEQSRESLQQLQKLLTESRDNPTTLLATPSRLLEAQPGLKSLKDGLSTARLELSRLRGIMRETHPKVQQAINAEQQIRKQLQAEVETSLAGIAADLEANQAQSEALRRQQQDVQERLDRLADVRARYHALLADARQRTETLDEIQRKLAQAQAAKNAATTSSQLTRFGNPVVGDRPVGPSRKMIAAGGMASGFSLGAGLVFLFMPIGPNGRSRRWSDYLNMGRRATDQFFGRRASDLSGSRTLTPVEAQRSPAVGRRESNAGYLEQPVVGGRRSGDLPPIIIATPTPPEAAPPSYPAVERRQSTGRRAADRGDMLP